MLKKFKLFITAAAVTAALFYSNPASAYPVVTDGKKEALEQMINSEISWYQTLAEYYGCKLKVNGVIRISNEDLFYSVVIPDVSLKMINTDKILHIGTIAANFVQRSEDIWDAKVSIPSLITLNDGDDKIEANINIGKQSLDVTWIPSKHIYPQITGSYQNLQLSAIKNRSPLISLNKLSFNSFLNLNHTRNWAGYNKARTWNGLSTFELQKLKASLDNGYSLEIGNLKNVTTHKEIDPIKSGINRNKIREALAGENKDGLSAKDDYMLARFKKLIFNDREPLNQLIVSGVTIRRLSPKDMKEISTIKLNVAEMKNGYIRLKNGLFNAKGWLEFHDFGVNGFAREYNRLIPADGRLSFDVRYIPLTSLNKVIFDNLSAIANPGKNKTVISEISDKFPPILQQANSYINITDAKLKNRDTNIRLNGNVVAKPKSVYGYSATFNMSLDGLDDPQKTFRALGSNPNIDLRTLSYAINMAAIATSKNSYGNGTIDDYKVKVFENGQIEVNGRGFNSK